MTCVTRDRDTTDLDCVDTIMVHAGVWVPYLYPYLEIVVLQ